MDYNISFYDVYDVLKSTGKENYALFSDFLIE